MGMPELGVAHFEFSTLDRFTHFTIGISERGACEDPSVYFLNAEKVFIFWIFQEVFFYLNLRKHERSHFNARSDFGKGRKDVFL
jgi:hypothetical protein